ncbi:MAG: hypothetical protein ACT4NY_31260 [Pseudonocardiales bacterium]
MTDPEPPDLTIAKRLLDACKRQGFVCQRVGTGEDAPLLCTRERNEYRDEILLNGFSADCFAVRQRTSRLVIVGGGTALYQCEGSALTVLNTVLTW